jgi:hypothetical protein
VKRIDVARHIAADAASVALLLADSHGVQGSGAQGSGAPGSTETRLRAADADILAVAAPRRGGIGFLADVTATVRGSGPIHGLIRVEPAADAGCDVRIGVIVPTGSDPAATERLAARFLTELEDRATSRSYAA